MIKLSNPTILLDSFQRKACKYFINYPGTIFTLGLMVMLGLSAIAGPQMEVTEGTNYDWIISSSQESKNYDIVNDIERQVDAASGYVDDGEESTIPERSEEMEGLTLMILYALKDKSNPGPVFTPEGLKAMCEVENVLYDLKDFSKFCVSTSDTTTTIPNVLGNCSIPTLSLIPYFYSWKSTKSRECILLDSQTIALKEQIIFEDLSKGGMIAAKWKFFMGNNVDIFNPSSTFRTRSYLMLGGPLKGYKDLQDHEKEQIKKYTEFSKVWEKELINFLGMKGNFFKSAYRSDAFRGPLGVKFFSQLFLNNEMERVINGDLIWTAASMLFVFIYTVIDTKSFFLAIISMLQIILSLPIAFFFYKYIFQIPFYTQLHILTIFLVLGVGPDNLFVLFNAWKFTNNSKVFNHAYPRLLYAYKRAFSGVFNTSFTTAMAFLSTAFSPIMPISGFGFYAATAVVVNYLYVVFFTPAVVILHHKYFEHRGLCGCNQKNKTKNIISKVDDELVESVDLEALRKLHLKELHPDLCENINENVVIPNEGNTDENFISIKTSPKKEYGLTKFFIGPYRSFVIQNQWISLTWVIFFTGLWIQGIYFSSFLSTPETQEEWFPNDHMSTGFMDATSNDFLAGPDDAYVKASLVWGTSGIDRSGFERWYPADNRGNVIWNLNFDITSKEAHDFIIETCDKLQHKTCSLQGCSDGTRKLVRQNSLQCWLKDMKNQLNGTSLPTGNDFITELKKFRAQNPQYKEAIGFVKGKLKYIQIQFTLTLLAFQPYGKTNPIGEEMQIFANEINKVAPSGVGNAFPYGSISFVWVKTEKGLVSGMFVGLAISFPIAFVVLLLSNGNLILSIYASISIAAIVVCVLGFCQSVMGWYLGIAESVSAVIVIGFSVDYVIHLGHTYEESLLATRKEKTEETAKIMGPTVVAGGITTWGAGACMFGCQMVFFYKMAVLITATISFSLLFSLIYFMSLCALIGPEGNFGKWKFLFVSKKKDSKKVEIKTEADS